MQTKMIFCILVSEVTFITDIKLRKNQCQTFLREHNTTIETHSTTNNEWAIPSAQNHLEYNIRTLNTAQYVVIGGPLNYQTSLGF